MRTAILLVVLAAAAAIRAAPAAETFGIILDTDFRSDVDDAGTLALLNALADNGECTLLGVVASQTGPHVVGAINAVNTWYGRGDVPIGLSPVDDQRFDDYYAPVIGNPANYPSTQSNTSAPDSTTLYRRLLHAAADQGVIVVVIGGQTCIHRLLVSPADPEGDGSIGRTGRQLIDAKVRKLVIMGGNFVDPDQREHNIALDVQAAQTVAESWPTPIVYSGFEIGLPVKTGGAMTDPQKNPVAKAYELFPAGGVGTIASSASFDQTALYYAVRGTRAGERTLWRLSDPGWASFPDARTRFARNAWGRHRHLVRYAGDAEVAAVIEGLMIQPPRRQAPPPQAGRPPNATTLSINDHGATPDDDTPDTAAIQAALDAAEAAGGGTVRIPRGRFISGAIQLRDNVRLRFEEGAVLEGSTDWRDYGAGRWHDALLTGENLRNVRLEGPGVIDGAACHNPKGEEGFRGPHAIRLNGCRDIVIRDLTITRAGNYAILCLDCTGAELHNLTMRGGHDGLHAQACRDFRVRDGDIRTGDDCFAGCDNTGFEIVNCKINSSCNGFRLGCVDLVVRDCTFWGPGEYAHLISARRGAPRTNMLSAFVHFAPADRRPRLPSDDWLIENCRIDNVDAVYAYDFERGGWQTGQPARRLRWRNVQAERVARPLRVLGDAGRQFELTLENVSIALREDRADQEVLHLTRFGALRLSNVTLQNSGAKPVVRAREGGLVQLSGVTIRPQSGKPYEFDAIDTLHKDDTGRIRPWPENPHYLAWGDTPVFPLGAAGYHSWTPISRPGTVDFEAQVDRLAAVIDAIGSPHVCGFMRCLPYDPMNHMHDGTVTEVLQPWVRLADGRHDLERFEPAWEKRLGDYLAAALRRRIVVSLEVWDDWSVTRGPGGAYDPGAGAGWNAHPFNPRNNINYGPGVFPVETDRCNAPFYGTIPSLRDIKPVLELQKRYVDRVLAIAGDYPNVLLNISNESRAHLEWSRFWAGYIRRRVPPGMMVGEMPSTNRKDGGGECEHAFSPMALCTDPRYDYVDISQGVSGHEFGGNPRQQALGGGRRILEYRRAMAEAGTRRPLVVSKDYTRGPEGGDMVLWSRFAGGAATARFHRLAGNHPASVSRFQHEAVGRLGRCIAQVPFWRMHPAPELVTALPAGAGANVLAEPGGHCVVQLIGGAAGEALRVGLPPGTWKVRWIDPATGLELGRSDETAGTAGLELKIPGALEHRIIHLEVAS